MQAAEGWSLVPAPVTTPLTEEQKALIDPTTWAKTLNWVMKRVVSKFGPQARRPEVRDAVTDEFARLVMSAARGYRPGNGSFATFLMHGVDVRIPTFFEKVYRTLHPEKVTGLPEEIAVGGTRFRRNGKLSRGFNERAHPTPVALDRLKVLTDEERDVLLSRYGGRSAEAVGADHGRDRSWCRRIEHEAMKKLGATP